MTVSIGRFSYRATAMRKKEMPASVCSIGRFSNRATRCGENNAHTHPHVDKCWSIHLERSSEYAPLPLDCFPTPTPNKTQIHTTDKTDRTPFDQIQTYARQEKRLETLVKSVRSKRILELRPQATNYPSSTPPQGY